MNRHEVSKMDRHEAHQDASPIRGLGWESEPMFPQSGTNVFAQQLQSASPLVSIVVVSYNTWDCLKQCLASVFANGTGIPYEVLVVDNASEDGSAGKVVDHFPAVRLIANEENVGFARANNQAIREAKGQYILLLNSDVILLRQSLERMVEFMSATPDCGIAGARLLNPDGSFQASFAQYPSLLGEFLLTTRLYLWTHGADYPNMRAQKSNQIRKVDWVGGACLLVRRATVEEIGMLDEDFFMYCEEVDWCYRVNHTRKWNVYYLPDAAVIHLGGQSIAGRRGWKRVLVYRGKLLFFRKHYGFGRTTALRMLYASVSLIKLGFSMTRHPNGDGTSYKEIIRECVVG